MRWFIAVALFSIFLGIGCLAYAHRFPVYSDIQALQRLQNEKFKMPSDEHGKELLFKDWYARMHALETPYKRFSDLGRGLCAASIGLLGAMGLWKWYHRPARIASTAVLLSLWSALWVVRIPFSFWYYGLRQWRTDYPWWADSIGIPIFGELFVFLIGAVLSTTILRALLKGHPLPTTIRFAQPNSCSGWARTVFFGCWMACLVVGVATGIPDGDEGMVISFTIASVVLLAFLSASMLPGSDESATAAVEPATYGT